jgi:hypothetical protein
MTVSTTIARVTYVGSGTTGPFTVPFPAISATDLRVIKTERATGSESVLMNGADYTVGFLLTPFVVLSLPITSAFTITIIRDPAATQLRDYTRNDKFPAESHEQALDLLTMLVQRVREIADRGIRFPESETTNPVLDRWPNRANKYLAFDALGALALREASDAVAAVDIDFTHGAPGIVRSVEAKLREIMVSVKDYGAVGDGVTDDRAAIQNAIDNCPNGGIIYFPPTSLGYRTSGTITVPPDRTLQGLTLSANENISSATIVGDLAVSPVLYLTPTTSIGSGLVNIGVSRAAGLVPAGSVGIYIQDQRYTKLENVRVWRAALGFHIDGSLGTTANRVITSQITEAHWLLQDAIQTRLTNSACGQDGSSDTACNEYMKIVGNTDTLQVVNCQFNHGSVNYALRWLRFENYTGVNGQFQFANCYVEMCNALFSQAASVAPVRIALLGCGLNPFPNWDDGTLFSGFFTELTMQGCPLVLPQVTLVNPTRCSIDGNYFLDTVTINGATVSTFSGNICNVNLALAGVMAGFSCYGNAINGGFNDASSGVKAVFGNCQDAAAAQNVMGSRFEVLSARTVRTDQVALAYAAAMTPDMSAGSRHVIIATNGVPFTINAPANTSQGLELCIVINNSSGGALGAVTWDPVFKMAAWTSPANGFNRQIEFWCDGVNWYEKSRTTTDIPN